MSVANYPALPAHWAKSATQAADFIERLQALAVEGIQPSPSPLPAEASTSEQALRRIPVELLAAEVRRRGWSVTEP